MKTMQGLCAIAMFAIAGAAAARCTSGNTGICYVDGVQGTRKCMDGEWGECMLPPPPPPKVYGIKARYKVLTVIYAPPGTTGGGSSSSVTYGSGSAFGSTTSSTNAFNQSYAVSASTTFGTNTGTTANFSYSRNTSNTRAIDLNKATGVTITAFGPAADGIDHNRDQIWLWLNPRLQLSLSNAAGQWSVPSQTMEVVYVYAGHLKDPLSMPRGVKDRLAAAGIYEPEYPEILKADPYAAATLTTVDAERYKTLNTTFPYEPPYSPGDPIPTYGYAASYSSTTSSSSSRTNTYSTGFTVETGVDLAFLQAKLSNQNQWTWTDTDTRSTSSTTSESAQVTLGGPSYGYTGPTSIGVYYDTLYKSFLFLPVTGAVQLKGSLRSSGNEPVAGREVVLTGADGVEHRTYTNARGEYRFIDAVDGPATISAAGERRTVQRAAMARSVDLVIP